VKWGSEREREGKGREGEKGREEMERERREGKGRRERSPHPLSKFLDPPLQCRVVYYTVLVNCYLLTDLHRL